MSSGNGALRRQRSNAAFWGELHASVCALVGALLLAGDGLSLLGEEGPWPMAGPPMLLAAALGAVAATLPWLWPQVPLNIRRTTILLALTIATGTSLAAMLPLGLDALLGAQLLLLSVVLSEMSGRAASLRWFWVSVGVVVASMLLYYALADLRPIAD